MNTITDARGVTYQVTKYPESPKHGGRKPESASYTLTRISNRPVDNKRAARKGMSNAAKRAARKGAL